MNPKEWEMFVSVSKLKHLEDLCCKFPSSYHFPVTVENSYEVPKTLHFLWIGSEIPKNYSDSVNAFSDMNAGYDVILWHDFNIPSGVLSSRVKTLHIKELNLPYLHLMSKLSTRVDYIRYVAIHSIGGIYSDIDSIPIRPFDWLLEKSFVSYAEEGWMNIQNSFFGFSKQSPFMQSMLNTIEKFSQMTEDERCGEIKGFHAQYTGGNLMGCCLWCSKDDGIRCISEKLTGHANTWVPVSKSAYCRHMYHFNWKDPNDPRGKD